MTKEAAAIKLTKIFPDKAAALTQHYTDYDNQLRAHIFFADEINIPLMLLLQSNSDKKRSNNIALLSRKCIMTAMKM